MNKDKLFNSRNKLIILGVVLLLLVIGATFAFMNLFVTNGIYSYKTTCFDIVYDSGEDILGDMFPSSTPLGGLSGTVTIGIDKSCGVVADGNLYLNVDSDTDGNTKLTEVVKAHCEDKNTLKTLSSYNNERSCIASQDRIWVTNGTALKYAVYESSTELVSVGYVDQIGDPITVYGDFELTSSTSYDIYIWLDGELVDNSYTDLSFSGNISADVNQKSKQYFVAFDSKVPVISVDGNITSVYNTSGEYTYTVPYSGIYKLEVWGAQGGSTGSHAGGYGGYSVGNVFLTAGDNIYIIVGGQGIGTVGGYNGGGAGGNGGGQYGSGGGGATHIAISSGLLSTFSSNVDSLLIVAGGGGGSGNADVYNGDGGSGGGINGVVGYDSVNSSYSIFVGTGGSQLLGGVTANNSNCSGGSFGLGANFCDETYGGNGGGGGYYGGGGSNRGHGGGGGGSGYIGNSLLTDKAMYCYNCNTSSDVNTLTYSITDVSSDAISNYAKNGDGAARITLLSFADQKSVIFGMKYGDLPTPTRDGYTFLGWYTDDGVLVTEDTIVDTMKDHTLHARWEYEVKFYGNIDQSLSASGAVIGVFSNRTFYKYNGEMAYAAYIYNGSYTGPVLVGKTADSVTYYTSYDGTLLTYTASIEYNGETYYYSSAGQWMSGNQTNTGTLDLRKFTGALATAAQQMVEENYSFKSQSFICGESKNINLNSYTKAGYTFLGWSASPTGEVMYTDGQNVKDILNCSSGNLYAIWKKNS